jgi:hypothetical protein
MSTLRTLVCVLLFVSAQALADERWLSIDMELSDKLRLGAAHPFDAAQLVFDDGIQIVNTNDKPTGVSTGAYLFEAGLADQLISVESRSDTGGQRIFEAVVGRDHQPVARIQFVTHIVDLKEKSLGTHAMLITASINLSQSKTTPTFADGAKCLLLESQHFQAAALYFSRQRFSPFKNIDAFEAHRKADLKQKITHTERGEWQAHPWMKISALGYQNRPYSTSAVLHKGRVYLADFHDKGHSNNMRKSCIAYNNMAIENLRSFFNR